LTASTETLTVDDREIVIRQATVADAETCGKICFEAFGSLSSRHGFPNDFPAPEIPVEVLSWMFAHPKFFCVVAEQDGKVIGSNCLDERTPIAGVGPITIDPAVQNHSAGRQLMQAVLARAADRNFPGVRLVQAAYHNRSLALYTKLGFIVRERIVDEAFGRLVARFAAGFDVGFDIAGRNGCSRGSGIQNRYSDQPLCVTADAHGALRLGRDPREERRSRLLGKSEPAGGILNCYRADQTGERQRRQVTADKRRRRQPQCGPER